MNCTVCGKPHSPEAPLTVITVTADEKEMLCSECIERLHKAETFIDTLLAWTAENHDNRYYGTPSLTGFSGTVKIGNIITPIKSFELKMENK
jgi:hypothetical protein